MLRKLKCVDAVTTKVSNGHFGTFDIKKKVRCQLSSEQALPVARTLRFILVEPKQKGLAPNLDVSKSLPVSLLFQHINSHRNNFSIGMFYISSINRALLSGSFKFPVDIEKKSPW